MQTKVPMKVQLSAISRAMGWTRTDGTLRECVGEQAAKTLRDGPEREVAAELRCLLDLLRRVYRHLAKFHAPLAPELQGWCQQVRASLPEVTNELTRLMP